MHVIGKNDPFELGKNPIFSDNEMHFIGKMIHLNWGKTLFSIGSHRNKPMDWWPQQKPLALSRFLRVVEVGGDVQQVIHAFVEVIQVGGHILQPLLGQLQTA